MDVEQLESLLASWSVDLSAWPDRSYALNRLASELRRGECVLDDATQTRIVHAARMIVDDDAGRRLHQFGFIDANGFQERDRSPGEKLHRGETPTEAGARGLAEELVVDPSRVTLIGVGGEERLEIPSGSYPTLRSNYTLHDVRYCVEGLPETDFWTVEHDDGRRVVHLWRWAEVGSGEAPRR